MQPREAATIAIGIIGILLILWAVAILPIYVVWLYAFETWLDDLARLIDDEYEPLISSLLAWVISSSAFYLGTGVALIYYRDRIASRWVILRNSQPDGVHSVQPGVIAVRILGLSSMIFGFANFIGSSVSGIQHGWDSDSSFTLWSGAVLVLLGLIMYMRPRLIASFLSNANPE